MRNHWILFPIVVQIILTLETYLALAWHRNKVAQKREVNLKQAAVDAEVWPERIRLINNNIRNQFELPILFYVLGVILWQMQAAGAWAQTLAWVFVISRVLHTYVHTGRNYVPLRFVIFLVGLLAVAGMAVMVLVAAFKSPVM